MPCGDVVAALGGVAVAVGVAVVVGVAMVVGIAVPVGVLDETAAVGVEVVGAGAEAVADEVVVDEVEPEAEPELEVPGGVACDWLSASRRPWFLVRCCA